MIILNTTIFIIISIEIIFFGVLTENFTYITFLKLQPNILTQVLSFPNFT